MSGPNLLPPDVATELAELRRRVADIERASGRYVPAIGGLADVDGMAWTDGQVLAYDRATGRWTPTIPHQAVPYLARKSGDSSLTTTYTTYLTLPGFDTTVDNSWLVIDIVLDCEAAALGGLVATGRCLVGGVAPDAGEAVWHEGAQRATVGQQYITQIAAASGPHSVVLQARKLVGAGDIVLHGPHTSIRVMVLG